MMGKLLERLINQAIMTHLSHHNLINDAQHGLLPKRSCHTNLLLYLELLTSCIDKGLDIDVLCLDFEKAFDKVPDKRLLKKVQAHGVCGKVYSWIENWLMDRKKFKQRVKINSSYSGWNKVTSGVPQGSILEPTLFLMYINDIENLNSTVLKFADDTKVMKVIDKVPDKRLLKKVQAHGVCGKVYSWIENWLMDRKKFKQRVKIKSSYSGWNKVTSGVPQGSILEPTLFLMYINDIENLNSTVLKFADDTEVMKVIDNHHCHADLQNDIKGLKKWAKLWQMQLNVDKCKMMHFGFNNTRHTCSCPRFSANETISV